MLQLNDTRIYGHNVVVRGDLELRTEDISGETSGTEVADKGTKAKLLRVSLKIPYKNKDWLQAIIRLAEAIQEGNREIYTITNRSADVAGIRQVRFAETVAWHESGAQQWDCSFVLREHMSVPERMEQREQQKPVARQMATGATISDTQHAAVLKAAEKSQGGEVLA